MSESTYLHPLPPFETPGASLDYYDAMGNFKVMMGLEVYLIYL